MYKKFLQTLPLIALFCGGELCATAARTQQAQDKAEQGCTSSVSLHGAAHNMVQTSGSTPPRSAPDSWHACSRFSSSCGKQCNSVPSRHQDLCQTICRNANDSCSGYCSSSNWPTCDKACSTSYTSCSSQCQSTIPQFTSLCLTICGKANLFCSGYCAVSTTFR